MAKKKQKLGRGIQALMDKEADKKTPTKTAEMGQRAVAWLKAQAIEHAGEYRGNHSYNIGDVVRGLGLGNGWDSREKVYGEVMRGLRRAEELGFVECTRHGSPIKFKFVGPEVEEAEKAKKKQQEQAEKAAQRLVNKVRIKGIELARDRYEDPPIKVEMSLEAFTKLAAKAGVS